MSILFDIGANHGKYTDANIKKYSSFVLVEANPMLCQELQLKYKDNPKIIIINAIASNKENETFYISNADQISTADLAWVNNSRFTKDYHWQPFQGIQTVSLDTLLQSFPEVTHIKVDVEGYEYNVIQSLHTKVPLLSFEWAEEKKEEILLTLVYLERLGFTQFHIQFEDTYTYEVPKDQWMPYNTVYELMNGICDADRKEKWGMIWAS